MLKHRLTLRQELIDYDTLTLLTSYLSNWSRKMFGKNRWPDDPRKKGHRAMLPKKVVYIAQLERRYASLGVSIQPGILFTKKVFDHVIGVLHAVAELDDNPERIHQIT